MTFQLPGRGSSSNETLPAFRATKAAAQSINAASATKVQADIKDFDTNNNYDNATNYRFTPTVSGKYQISAYCRFDAIGDRKPLTVSIYKNGSLDKEFTTLSSSGGSINCHSGLSILVSANGTTDYFEMYVTQGDTAARNINEVIFSGAKVG